MRPVSMLSTSNGRGSIELHRCENSGIFIDYDSDLYIELAISVNMDKVMAAPEMSSSIPDDNRG